LSAACVLCDLIAACVLCDFIHVTVDTQEKVLAKHKTLKFLVFI